MAGDGLSCVVKGCPGIACYGFGSVRKDTLRRACRDHRHLIWPAAADNASRSEGGRRAHQADGLPPPPASPRQGNLFGS